MGKGFTTSRLAAFPASVTLREVLTDRLPATLKQENACASVM